MPVTTNGAQRASRTHPAHLLLVAALAALLSLGGLITRAEPVAAATTRVVIVVGPTGSETVGHLSTARRLASQARAYGASVREIYSPYATWARVKNALQGAHMLIYLGHGNGWPSPYGPYQPYTKDGLGLNASGGNGHYNVRYWGEYYLATQVRMARNAVVILNHLCYASGNSEWGWPNPTLSTAKRRVDMYGAGFLRTGAKAVFAEGIDSVGYILYGLFRTNRTISQVFWSSPDATRTYARSFTSSRTANSRALMDPYRPGRYYRSVIGNLSLPAGTWRP